MATMKPLFIDITWGAGGRSDGDDAVRRRGWVTRCSLVGRLNAAAHAQTSSMTLAHTAVKYCGLPTQLHLTCADLTRAELVNILTVARSKGITNILALRGDPPRGQTKFVPKVRQRRVPLRYTRMLYCCLQDPQLQYGSDVVRVIREEFGDTFGICVAGYPLMHPEATSLDDDIRYLKVCAALPPAHAAFRKINKYHRTRYRPKLMPARTLSSRSCSSRPSHSLRGTVAAVRPALRVP